MITPLVADSRAPSQLFFHTAEQRTALARQMFFEEGQRPTGLVSEAVIQSWMRCLTTRQHTSFSVSFDPVTPSRLHSTLRRNQALLQVARQELPNLDAILSGTNCKVLLIDTQGVIVHTTPTPHVDRHSLLDKTARVGVNVSETVLGTTAPGIVTKTGQACTVTGAEHYHDYLDGIKCAAAPICDVQGKLAAVLDISIESGNFGFDAAAVVGLYATSIENRLLRSQSVEFLVLHFQINPTLLGSPMEALAGVSSSGKIVWLNSVGKRMLGNRDDLLGRHVRDVLGLELDELLALTRQDGARNIRLPSGLGMWMQIQSQLYDGVNFNHAIGTASRGLAAQDTSLSASSGTGSTPEPAATPHPEQTRAFLPQGDTVGVNTLGNHSFKVIKDTLASCGGNVSRAARTLGVSRGLLYRRLSQARPSD
ncbi:MAG: helix-turn-helix domain-containing protein [Burkholderiaceae bacterium]|nr:helix-turn-helix domain-containing protein [Burkholderiaceae bacterium]